MRKLFSLLAILSLVSGMAWAYDGDGNPNTRREIAGAPAYSPYREYQLVRYAANGPNDVQLSAGDVVVADVISDDGITVGLIGTAVSPDAVAGVVVSATIPTCDVLGSTAQTDFGRRNWGFVQVKGYCSKVNITSGPVTAGGALYASTTARYATKGTGKTNIDGQIRTLGFAYDASSDGQSEAYISL